MPDTTLRLRYPSGATLDTQIENEAGEVWNGTAYVPFATASWAAYATATPEGPAGSGRFAAQFPISSPAGNYAWTMFQRLGGAPAAGDTVVGTGSGYWDGTTFGNVPGVAVAALPTPAPEGYGPIGTGSVTVNQDYPTAGNLSFQTSGGQGIGGALVRAYLTSEYTASPNTATVRGQTLTLSNGSWANNIDLDPEDYSITFKADGYQLLVVPVTVS
jgi:hypothetical protein